MIMSKIKIHWAGRDADGRSCLKSEEVEISGVIGVHPIWTGLASEPPAALGGRVATQDIGVALGSLCWMIGRFEPGFKFGNHRSDTWDLHAIVQGSAISILDDGRHELTVGDFLIMQGVDHAWEAGPEGYISSIFVLGAPPAG